MAASMDKIIKSLYDEKKYRTLKDILSLMNDADIAELFDELPKEALPVLFRLLSKTLAADTFILMDSDTQEALIHGFSDNELKEVLDELYVDEAVNIVDEMPANVVTRILQNTDPQKRQMINTLLQYPDDSAGSLMTTEYISLRPGMTISDAIKRIRRSVTEAKTIYTCYVIDDNRCLLGYISVRTLLISDKNATVGEIMDTTPIYVYTFEDKEDVAKKMNKYDFVTMPVTDDEMRLVGIVMFDDAIDVMQEEATEDLEMMAAMAHSEDGYFKTSDIKHARNRILWLLILMLGAAITGSIITNYENAFQAFPVLVSFIPMLMGTGGNCGAQSSTMIIRGMSTDEIHLKDFLRVLWMEFRISLLLSFALAAVNGLRIFFVHHNLMLSVVVSLSIVGTVIMAEVIGCMLPMLAKKCRLDPAIMASPIITTIVDAGSILIYFSIASKFFNL